MVRSIQGKHPGYYEAILQLRNTSKEVYDFVLDEINRKKVHLTKESKQKNGLDLYLSDNSFTKALGKKLQEKFGGQILTTASLHTKKDNKELYRITVLFRQASFKKSDLVIYQGETYKVKQMGKDILLQHNKTGKKVHLKYKEISQISISEECV